MKHRALIGAVVALVAGAALALALAPGETRSQSFAHRRVAPQLARDNIANILSGDWAGPGIRLLIAGDGTAEFEFDCAHGTAPGPLSIASNGSFAWPGRWVRERGGPVRQGDDEDAYAAVYGGQLVGDELRLNVTVPESGLNGGSFVLKAGEPGRIVKCL